MSLIPRSLYLLDLYVTYKRETENKTIGRKIHNPAKRSGKEERGRRIHLDNTLSFVSFQLLPYSTAIFAAVRKMSINRIILAGHQFCQISIYSAARNKLSRLPDFSTLPRFPPSPSYFTFKKKKKIFTQLRAIRGY